MLIRSEVGRRRAEEERERFARDLEAGGREVGPLRTRYEERIREIDEGLDEYERLRSGTVSRLVGEGVSSLGDVITKARVARGMSLAEFGEALDMKLQQVQRYESEGWRRAGLWRLARVAEVLGLRVRVEALLEPLDGGADD